MSETLGAEKVRLVTKEAVDVIDAYFIANLQYRTRGDTYFSFKKSIRSHYDADDSVDAARYLAASKVFNPSDRVIVIEDDSSQGVEMYWDDFTRHFPQIYDCATGHLYVADSASVTRVIIKLPLWLEIISENWRDVVGT